MPTFIVIVLIHIQAFVFLVSRRVDALEEYVSKTERSMDPGKLRKMFTSLPGVFSVSVLILMDLC